MTTQTLRDPEVATAIADLPIANADWSGSTPDMVPAIRTLVAEALAVLPAAARPQLSVSILDVAIPGPPGEPDVTVRVYRPEVPAAPGAASGSGGAASVGLPCMVWIHGGGYIFGSGLEDDPRLERWCDSFGLAIVSVDYRLAPEHPYPAPLEDCYAALRWASEHGGDFGIDTGHIGVGGASAGGGLAAALALLARDRGEISLGFQLLLYPMLDDRDATASLHQDDLVIWTRAANLLGWECYLGDLSGGAGEIPSYAAPARAIDLSGLPRALICVGTLDAFRDEDITYAKGLLEAGVPADLHVYAGVPHAFESIVPQAQVSRLCEAEIDRWLAAVIAVSTAG